MITTIIVYVVQKNRAYILVGEMVLRKIMPLDFHGTMTEIPETRRTNGCVLIVVSLKLAVRFLPFWSFLSILGRGVVAEPIIIALVCHRFAVHQTLCKITLKLISSH